MRAPQTTRAKVSRPRSSVSNGCASVGALRTSFQSVCNGSTRAIHGAPSAMATKSTTTTAPMADAGRRRATRHARRRRGTGSTVRVGSSAPAVAVVLGITRAPADANPRIEKRVGDVYQQVDQHVRAGREEYDPLDERIVAREHRLDDEPAEAGHDEDLFGDNRAAHERAHLQPEDRDDRDEAVADGVAEHDDAAGEPFAVG